MNVWRFFATHREEILAATHEHLSLVLVSMAIAVAIAVPLGLALVSRPRLRATALAVASIFQTIPSLALFGFLIPLPFLGGIGGRTAIIALVLYALLPILRNTYVGLTGIDPAIIEAAEAMGMTERQILFSRAPSPGHKFYPCRYSHRHCHYHRCRHHCGGHRSGRSWYVYFSRSRDGQRRGNSRWGHTCRTSGVARRLSARPAGTPVTSRMR